MSNVLRDALGYYKGDNRYKGLCALVRTAMRGYQKVIYIENRKQIRSGGKIVWERYESASRGL